MDSKDFSALFDFAKLCLNLFDFVKITQLCTNFVLVKITFKAAFDYY